MTDGGKLYDEFRAALRAEDGSVQAFFHPDFVAYEDPGLPYGGVFRGGESFVALRRKVYETWGPNCLELQYRVGDDDGHAIAYFKLTGRPAGSDETVESYVTLVWAFEDGLAKEARILYYNTPLLTQALSGQ